MDFELLAKKYRRAYSFENHDRPLIRICTKKDNAPLTAPPKAPDILRDRWLDLEYVIKNSRYNIERTAYLGEAYPHAWINFGPDIMGAICGCDIEFGDITSWAIHDGRALADYGDIVFDPGNEWFKRLDEYTKALADDSRGDYAIGITDLHPGMDAIVSLRGPENTCFDLIECPETVKKVNFQIFEVYKKVYEAQYNAATKYMPFISHWLYTLCDDRNYVTSCDFSCMISTDDFQEFVMPELAEEIHYFDTSILLFILRTICPRRGISHRTDAFA